MANNYSKLKTRSRKEKTNSTTRAQTEQQTDIEAKPQTKTLPNERRLTVGYVPSLNDCSTPNIQLKGKWLIEAGFPCGTKLIVKIINGVIEITPEPETVTQYKQLQVQLKQTQEQIKLIEQDLV